MTSAPNQTSNRITIPSQQPEVIKVCPYHWTEGRKGGDRKGGENQNDPKFIIDESDPNYGRTTILSWTLNQKSEPVLVRFHDFPLTCYVELPQVVGQAGTASGLRPFDWSKEAANYIVNWIKKALKDDAPISHVVISMKKLYYYRFDREYPMILLSFRNVNALNHCENLLKKPQNINGIGIVQLKTHEVDIGNIRKLLTVTQVKFSQWFKIDAIRVPDDDKISSIEHEYIGNWQTMSALSPEETKGWVTSPRVLMFDIECYSDNHKAMPRQYDAKHWAYMISCIYQRLNDRKSRKKVMIIIGQCDPIDGVEIVQVQTEKQLCDEFIRLIAKLDPEVLSGYNIMGFDYPYLDARLKRKLNEWLNDGSRLPRFVKISMNSKAWHSSGFGFNETHILDIPGRISIDLFPMIRREYKLSQYRLDDVAQFFLGCGKHDIKPEQMFIYYENLQEAMTLMGICQHPDYKDKIHPDVIKEVEAMLTKARAKMTEVARYCIQDSELVVDIFDKIHAWILLVETSSVVGVPVVDLYTRGQQIRGVSQVYNKAAQTGHVLDQRVVPKIDYAGAFVFEPTPGLYDYVICLDFKSMYPNIIIAYNIDYTTLIPKELEEVVPDEKCHLIEWDEDLGDKEKETEADTVADDVKEESDDEDDDEKKVKGRKRHFRYKWIKQSVKKGIVPELVDNLIKERNEVRKQMKSAEGLSLVMMDKKQNALKINANSMYGMMGVQEGGKLPLIEGAMCVTAIGRRLILQVNDIVEKEYGGKVIYNDTDSTMVILPQVKNGKDAFEWGKKLEKEISAKFPPPLYIEFEKAGRVFCIKKKKYAFWKYDKKTGELSDPTKNDPTDPPILYKGIVLARRDNCMWQRNVYQSVLSNILQRKAMQDTLDLIIKECLLMLAGKVKWTDLTIVRSMGANYKSDTYFMKVFGDELRKLGKPANKGDRLEYVVVPAKDPQSALLGYRMRLKEVYHERLGTDQEERTDALYYLHNVLRNCVEQLWQIGFKKELQTQEEQWSQYDCEQVFRKLIEAGHLQHVELAFQMNPGRGYDDVIKWLETQSSIKNKAVTIRRQFINRNIVNYRITDQPIKLMLKAIERNELSLYIEKLASPKLIDSLRQM